MIIFAPQKSAPLLKYKVIMMKDIYLTGYSNKEVSVMHKIHSYIVYCFAMFDCRFTIISLGI